MKKNLTQPRMRNLGNCVTFNGGGNFFFDRLLLEKAFDGKLRFGKDFRKL